MTGHGVDKSLGLARPRRFEWRVADVVRRQQATLVEQPDAAVAYLLPVDLGRQLEREHVELLPGQLWVARAHPADVRILVVEMQPRPRRRVQRGRADVDDPVLCEPRVDPRLALELAAADVQCQHLDERRHVGRLLRPASKTTSRSRGSISPALISSA